MRHSYVLIKALLIHVTCEPAKCRNQTARLFFIDLIIESFYKVNGLAVHFGS